jgi:hypothetical protein
MARNEFAGDVSRREVLQAAGGFTLLGLLPAVATAEGLESGVHEAVAGGAAQPIFNALPYLQPGAKSSKLVDGQESVVIAWQTNHLAAEFALSYGERGLDSQAAVRSFRVASGHDEDDAKGINYVAELDGLKLGTVYQYKVTMNGRDLLKGHFTTRQPRGKKIRFVSFGDNSFGDMSDRAIAYQAYMARPDFIMNTGDLVYDAGLNNEYARYFFPVYNSEQAGPRTGAPLLRSVPLYTVLANHDLSGHDAHGHPAADFAKFPDSLGYFSNLNMPLNGPDPSHPIPLAGPEGMVADFKQSVGDRYPRQANYSFDYGDVHFLCLDSNVTVDPTDEALQAWIASDLSGTDAIWKVVVFHHPSFNIGHEHYDEQHMRALSPLFEQHGVHLVLQGHEHTYQRTRPLKFAPSDLTAAKAVGSGRRLVPGTFTVDRNFDGKSVTKADGVIYVTTGAGGKHLYDPDQNGAPGSWMHEEDSNADYGAAFVSDRHSLTVLDVDSRSMTVRQIDEWGGEVDWFRVTV